MARWIAGIITYNEEQLLPGCLKSLQGKVDQIVVVDGRISEMPGESPCSTDNTVAIALGFGARVIQTTSCPWQDEQDARNQYLVGEEGDWYLVIDADEKLMTPLPPIDEMPPGEVFKVPLRMLMFPGQDIYPQRLIKHTGQMEYRFTHDALYSNGRHINNRRITPVLHSVWLLHRQPLRTKERRADKKIKRVKCRDKEAQYRELYDL